MTRPRTSGVGRRFELVLIRLRPPDPETVGLIAKHAAPDSYHWILIAGRSGAEPERLARLLAVAYLDEASGILGRGDPRWALPRASLRSSGELAATERPDSDDPGLPPFVRRELGRIAAWLLGRHREYLEDLAGALRRGPPDGRFRPLGPAEARERAFSDPLGRGILAPDPPPVVTRTRPAGHGGDPSRDATDRLAWRSFRDRGA